MKNKKPEVRIRSLKELIVVTIGIVFLLAGVLIIFLANSEGIIAGVCFGLGAGFLSGGIGGAINNLTIQKNPDLAKQIEIDSKDERNITLGNKAKAKAFNCTLLILAALNIFFAVMQVNVFVILALTASYLLIIIIFIYFLQKYHKEN